MKPKDDPGWITYEAVLEDVHFAWPALKEEGFKKAKNDCIEYLDKILDERYILKEFNWPRVTK